VHNDPAFSQFVPDGAVTVKGMSVPAIDVVLALLHEELSVRGRACIALGRVLSFAAGRSFPVAVGIAKDLLEHDTVETCETLVALVADGWNDTVSALLLASRELNTRNI
jgi:hypothetical protein